MIVKFRERNTAVWNYYDNITEFTRNPENNATEFLKVNGENVGLTMQKGDVIHLMNDNGGNIETIRYSEDYVPRPKTI